MALVGLIDFLFHSLKGLSMSVFDAEAKVLDIEVFPQSSIAELNSGTARIILFS